MNLPDDPCLFDCCDCGNVSSGGELFELVLSRGRLPEALTQRWFREMASGKLMCMV